MPTMTAQLLLLAGVPLSVTLSLAGWTAVVAALLVRRPTTVSERRPCANRTRRKDET
jgi:hypothetical protein